MGEGINWEAEIDTHYKTDNKANSTNIGTSQVVPVVKNPPANAGDARDAGSIPGPEERSSLRRNWQTTPVFLLGKFHGQRSLVGYSSWGCKELDMTEHI